MVPAESLPGNALTPRAYMARCAEQTRHTARLLPALVAAIAFSWQPSNAWSAGQPVRPSTSQASSSATGAKLPTIQIEAPRDLRRQVDQFVTSMVVQPRDESLMRWNMPICPVAEGLPRMFTEFIQTRISQIARSAGAPVAGKGCAPNFYVFATLHPDQLLKRFLAQNPQMYSTENGVAPVKRFLHSRRPVRVWYNALLGCPGGISDRALLAPAQLNSVTAPYPGMGGAQPATGLGPVHCGNGLDTRTAYGVVRSIVSVFIVVDMKRVRGVTTRQLANYVAIAGLADISLDAQAGSVPSILRLFQHPKHPPRGLSAWDRALLHSLYNTEQSSFLQVSDMEMAVVNRFTHAHNSTDTSSRSSTSRIPLWVNDPLPPPDAKASYWLRIGADMGIAAAQFDQGVRYALGEGVPRDYIKAAQFFHNAAAQGDVDAELNLGGLYNRGLGVPQDYAEAAQWFRKAAEQGNAYAQSSLGVAYANGRGVPQDYSQAVHWYRLAAEQGEIAAQVNLAAMYERGDEVPQDYAQAVHWYRMAAEQGNVAAQINLGTLFAKGNGVPQDYAEAIHWYRIAAEQGNVTAQYDLGVLYAHNDDEPKGYATAAQWFRKAAEQGNAQAQFDLGELYNSGRGVPRDSVRAYKWWIVANADSNSREDVYNWSLNEMEESASRMKTDQLARAHREAADWIAAHRSAH
jgi:TPR repeat protein